MMDMGLKSALASGEAFEILALSFALIILAWRRVTELRARKEERLEARREQYRLSYVDEASGLYNRRYLKDFVLPSIANDPHAVLLLDLDGFKKINDLYGHALGDTLLREVATRMMDIGPSEASYIRLGGDEFVIFLAGNAASRDEVTRFAARLVKAIDQPFEIGNVLARVSASIGIAASWAANGEPSGTLHRADIAMYEAKRAGRNRHVWFDASMEKDLLERNQLEADIRTGLERGEFVPYFQPLMDLETSRLKGLEVLARWNHPEKGLVLPDQFIPVAEETGVISELSFRVMEIALKQALTWSNELTIAVNVSLIQFRDPLLPERIEALLNEIGFPPERLELEITESAILDNKSLTLTSVHRLRDMGIRISIDDFGTGYASLSQLRELPFDRIKIDRSFVSSLMHNKQSDAIVQAITSLGRGMALPITAEGVEEEATQHLLAKLGCTDVQGWLYGQAMSGEDIGASLFAQEPATIDPDDQYTPQIPMHERRSFARRGR
ncbi:putative bifunctional diguanylate cyclase/phosphodiesterase [Altererythrobacter sp. GH1-8]|uniref:putative bifunctional diguanylate cyclase/phosphodiesterase n=1 Tax=Altererythrobacter sp. GH1-8 TaxID=3349333 RepID=UPI00374CAB89